MFGLKKYYKLDDLGLLAALKKNDEVAFKEIYNRYWQKMLTVAIYKTKSREFGQEVVQDLFVKIWEKRHTLQILHLERYLFGALKNLIIDKLRQILKERTSVDLSEIDISEDFHDALTIAELETLIQSSINDLPDKTAEIFKLSRYEAKSNAQIASIADVSVKAVEYHITKALKTLKANLHDYLP
jgi:RNA polymerase sigma-70 factor (family 1)